MACTCDSVFFVFLESAVAMRIVFWCHVSFYLLLVPIIYNHHPSNHCGATSKVKPKQIYRDPNMESREIFLHYRAFKVSTTIPPKQGDTLVCTGIWHTLRWRGLRTGCDQNCFREIWFLVPEHWRACLNIPKQFAGHPMYHTYVFNGFNTTERRRRMISSCRHKIMHSWAISEATSKVCFAPQQR